MEDCSTVRKASGDPSKRKTEKNPFSWGAKRLLMILARIVSSLVKFSEVEERGGSNKMETACVRKQTTNFRASENLE